MALRQKLGRVSREQELCLQLNTDFLIRELVCEEIVPKLHSKLILSGSDVEKILGAGGARIPGREQNKRLIDTIVMRRPQGFQAFLQALDETGHEAAAKKLRDTLEQPATHTAVTSSAAPDSKVTAQVTAMLQDTATRVESMGERVNKIQHREKTMADDNEHKYPDEMTELEYQDELYILKECVDDLDTRLEVVESLEHHAEVIRLKQELADAREELECLRRQNAEQAKSVKELHGKNAELTSILKDKSDQLREAREKIERLDKRIRDLDTENKFLRNSVTKLQTHEKEADCTIRTLKKQVADQKDQHDKDITRMRSEKVRDRKVFDDFKIAVENRLDSLTSQIQAKPHKSSCPNPPGYHRHVTDKTTATGHESKLSQD